MSIPDLLALHQSKPDAYPYLLASNTQGEINTRFSLLLAHPEQTHVQLSDQADILSLIDTNLNQDPSNDNFPFIGGWFVYLGYEYAGLIEPSVDFHAPDSDLPIAFISRIPAAIVVDHQKDRSYIVSTKGRKDLIQTIQDDIASCQACDMGNIDHCEIVEEHPDYYRSMLRSAHKYIHEGDIFQANLSRLWQVDLGLKQDPLALYQRLRLSNPSPFAALVKFNDHYILSSSPERLISVHNGIAETRPIAGTHPRGTSSEQDRQLSQQLLGHPKERAEHVMLIDLERNDLGRVCKPGSIEVRDKMTLETYQHVHHIVSSITGQIKNDISVRDVVHATFPGGTITGCPKVRCMQIISELEKAPRGVYTGSLGYVSDHGAMDLNILIRTVHVHDNHAAFRAGAGIVNDSITEKELNETRYKARGLINAFQPDH